MGRSCCTESQTSPPQLSRHAGTSATYTCPSQWRCPSRGALGREGWLTLDMNAPDPATRFCDLIYAHIGDSFATSPRRVPRTIRSSNPSWIRLKSRSPMIARAIVARRRRRRGCDTGVHRVGAHGADLRPPARATTAGGIVQMTALCRGDRRGRIVVRDVLPAGLLSRLCTPFERFVSEAQLESRRGHCPLVDGWVDRATDRRHTQGRAQGRGGAMSKTSCGPCRGRSGGCGARRRRHGRGLENRFRGLRGLLRRSHWEFQPRQDLMTASLAVV